MQVLELARAAREAAYSLAATDAQTRNRALLKIKKALDDAQTEIFSANAEDLKNAETEGLTGPLLKRLAFDEKKLALVGEGLDTLAALPDPLRRTLLARELTPGLDLYRVSCPLGVLGIVFESRPDALVQIASLALKSGNAALLKGGREAINTNRALFAAIKRGTDAAGIPGDWLALLETRQDVAEMLKADDSIDLIIPRGGNAFVKYIMDNTRIPVMGHSEGLCHTYIDASADVDMAVRVSVDAKTQSYAVCNATETLLVHEAVAPAFLPKLYEALHEKHVLLKGDERTRAIIPCAETTEEDWRTEYLDAILSIKVVDSIREAIAHINHYGSHHTDAILTADTENARLFTSLVDSAGVYVNCSTRFADGYRYGFGAEVGIATGKLHARGPVGIEGLCTYKYILLGSGQTVAQTLDGTLSFTHHGIDKNCPLA